VGQVGAPVRGMRNRARYEHSIGAYDSVAYLRFQDKLYRFFQNIGTFHIFGTGTHHSMSDSISGHGLPVKFHLAVDSESYPAGYGMLSGICV